MIEPAELSSGGVAAESRLTVSGDGWVMESRLHRSHRVEMTRGIFSPHNSLLRDCLAERVGLLVTSPTVDRIYGQQVRAYFGTEPEVPVMVLDRTEATKSLDAVVEVGERAAASGLRRTAPIVAVGGGVCTDIGGLAAALYRRGVPHVNIPTTLVGMVDAGIGTKNAVNHGGRKSAYGTFHPPEHTLIDPGFLATLPARQLANGLAEVIKVGVVKDAILFRMLAKYGTSLLRSGFGTPADTAEQVVRRSVAAMLAELTCNQFEIAEYRRRMDYGHTFSPYIEVASQHTILHGEAVAMDMALSAQLSHELGELDDDALEQILSLIGQAGLDLTWPSLSLQALWETLPGIRNYRDGNLYLVIPTAIGDCTYLAMEQLSPRLLQTSLDKLQRRVPLTAQADKRLEAVFASRSGAE